MKRFLCALVLMCMLVPRAWADVSIDSANFPDDNFRSYVSTNCDTDGDGVLSDAEIASVTSINVRSRNIASLTGIEYFTALTYLYCYSNQLTALDVSKNTKLTYLTCYSNQLTALDVSSNTALTTLQCNSNKLTALDVSSNTALMYLSCNSNKLTALDVSSNTALTTLYCDSNQLTALDVSSNTALTDLRCDRNQLTALDVSNNTALTRLDCDSNQLTALDVSSNTALTYLYCDSNQLTALDVSSNTALITLQCNSNKLTALDVSSNTALTYLRCSSNQLTALDVSSNTSLTYLSCSSNQLTALDVSSNTSLTYLYCDSNQLTALDVSSNTALTDLRCSSNQLTALDVSNNTALTRLDCYSNQLTALDVSSNTALTELYCYSNQLTALDVSNNTALTTLRCYSQTVSPLRITGTGDSSYPYQLNFSSYMSSDKFANVSDVQGIDSSNTNITTTYADGLAKFAALPAKVTYNYNTGYTGSGGSMDVTISDTASSSADVEINAANFPDDNFRSYVSTNFDTDGDGILSASEIADVLDIYVNDMSISSLTGIEHFTALEYLQCYGNQLTVLDISKNTALTELRCQNNQLTALDLSKNTALTAVQCYNNQLTSLNVSSNTALTSLRCQYNQLTELDVSNNTALSILYCNNNQLKVLDVSSNTALSTLDCTSQTVSPLTITSTGDSSYPYQLNFSAYMSSAQFANVSDVHGIGSNSEDITTAYASGVATFASRPEKVTYNYATGYGSAGLMDVTISGTEGSTTPVSSGDVSVDETNFPDSTFRSYISTNFDTNGDGVLSDSEIANVTNIDVHSMDISSLTGVEYFTALTELDCWDNQLTTLDVSKNTALTHLYCYSNQLTEIDVSKNTALTHLDCSSNDILALDVSKNTALRNLDCDYNQLTELDVSNNTALTWLSCSNNQLTALNVSKNTALMFLDCYMNQLTALDVSKNTALRNLDCDYNQLTELDVSNNTALTDLYCYGNQLTALDVSKNTALTGLRCENNYLTALDLSNNTALTTLGCYSQTVSPLRITSTGDSSYPYQLDFSAYMSSDKFANVSGVQGLDANSHDIATTYADGIAKFATSPAKVTYDYATGSKYDVSMDVTISGSSSSIEELEISSTNFPDSAFRSYVSSNFDSDNNGALSESEISAVTQINVNSMNISSLKGIELFTSLNGLNCTENRLTELDLSRNTALTEVWAMSNDIASLNVNGCTSLRKLGLHGNNLTQLDVSGLSSLEELHCGDMNLSTLIIGNKPYLTQLYCYRNQLTALDVTGCPALTHLHFGGNRISSIDLSKCTRLEYLHCWSNNLVELDLSGLTSLKNLNCSNNALRILDLSGASLTEFNADNQSFNAPVIYSTGDSSYPYRADLSAYVTAGNVSNVVNVYAYDSSSNSIATVYENGTARFASLPSTLTYTYSTGGGNMSVNVSYGNASVTNDTPSVPDTPVTPGPNTGDNPSPIPDESEAVRGQVTVNGHRYAVYDIKLTWTDAQAYCESLGGHLATIRTREEQEAISAIILESDAEAYWLGGRRNDSGAWMWLDGSEWNFTNWDTEHGQNGDSGERLLIYGPAYSGTPSAFYASDETLGTPGKWGSAPANTDAALYGFICEWTQTQTPIETAIVSPITQVTDDLRERLANLVSIDRSEVNFITSAEINPSEAREPTQAMRQSLADQSGEFLAKLNTIKVNKDGWYALVVTVSDDLVGASVSNLRLFYAEESDFAEGSLSASFGLMPIVNGITGGLEITDLFGVKLDTLPKQFIAMMMLSAGKSLSVYIVKILLMLLAGCSTGAGALIVLVMFIAKRYRKK